MGRRFFYTLKKVSAPLAPYIIFSNWLLDTPNKITDFRRLWKNVFYLGRYDGVEIGLAPFFLTKKFPHHHFSGQKKSPPPTSLPMGCSDKFWALPYNLNTLSPSQITMIFEFLLIKWSVAPSLSRVSNCRPNCRSFSSFQFFSKDLF